jgi:UDP-N-acetyl-D-mannosaminuronate dehydrogenase
MSYTEPSGRYIEWTLEGNQRQPHSHSCLAYELDIDDEPESLSYVLMELLTERGAEVEYHDPNVATTRPTRKHSQWAGKKSVE